MAKKDNSQLLNSMDENDYSFGSDSDIEADIRELLSYKAKKKPGRPKNPNTNAMMKVLLKVAKDVSTVSENISKVTQQLEVTNSHLESVISRAETLEVKVESLTREAKDDSDRCSILEQESGSNGTVRPTAVWPSSDGRRPSLDSSSHLESNYPAG